jgi:hypothetical protein
MIVSPCSPLFTLIMYFSFYCLLSVVDTATGYRLDGLGIASWWGWDFLHLSRLALGPTQPPVQGVPGLPQGYEWPGCDADPPPPSSVVVMKEQSYTSPHPMSRTARTEPQYLYKGVLSRQSYWWPVSRMLPLKNATDVSYLCNLSCHDVDSG